MSVIMYTIVTLIEDLDRTCEALCRQLPHVYLPVSGPEKIAAVLLVGGLSVTDRSSKAAIASASQHTYKPSYWTSLGGHFSAAQTAHEKHSTATMIVIRSRVMAPVVVVVVRSCLDKI